LLLHTLGWQDYGRRAAAGDHWQRLRTNIDVEQQVGAVPAVAALAQIDVGAIVLVKGIVSRPLFNGCRGKVVAPFNTEKQRCVVVLADGRKVLVKMENLLFYAQWGSHVAKPAAALAARPHAGDPAGQAGPAAVAGHNRPGGHGVRALLPLPPCCRGCAVSLRRSVILLT
jgi:hypothetical protein